MLINCDSCGLQVKSEELIFTNKGNVCSKCSSEDNGISKEPTSLVKISWTITLLSCIPAYYIVGLAFTEDSSPKQAATGALALSICVIPYILSRAVQELRK